MTSSTRGSSSSSSCTSRRWASLVKIVSIVDIQRCGRVRRVVDAADRDHVLKLVVTYKVVCITSIIVGTIMKSHELDKNDADHHQAYLLLGVSLDSILAERSLYSMVVIVASFVYSSSVATERDVAALGSVSSCPGALTLDAPACPLQVRSPHLTFAVLAAAPVDAHALQAGLRAAPPRTRTHMYMHMRCMCARVRGGAARRPARRAWGHRHVQQQEQ